MTDYSFSDMFDQYFTFPYIYARGIIPIEIGFGLLVKAISLTGASPQTIISIITACSAGLRAQLMKSIGMPTLCNVLINIFAITLMESNAIRLGLSTTILIFGLRNIYFKRYISGSTAIFCASLFHIQSIIFAIPFAVFYIFSKYLNSSRPKYAMLIIVVIAIEALSIKFVPLPEFEKIQDYVASGSSSSAGLTITSVVASLLVVSTIISLRFGKYINRDSNFFAAIVASSLPSLILLIMLTDVAVVGDRAWQLAFTVFTTFFFLKWSASRYRFISIFLLYALILISLSNIIFRFPLSNFFSPPLPHFMLLAAQRG